MLVNGPDSPPNFERRRHLRQPVNTPAFASFDGVTGGMILDLSERGMSMQTVTPLNPNQPHDFQLDLLQPDSSIETTGFIAWADALGRAGVRFSDLPEEARQRLREWLSVNAGTPSRTAPKIAVERAWGWGKPSSKPGSGRLAISLEAGPEAASEEAASWSDFHPSTFHPSTTVQYEFNSLGTDLPAALQLIARRARSLTRATSAAIALEHAGSVLCRASIGSSAPALGTRLDVTSGLSGACFREARTLRCDDTELDPLADLESCRRLGVRSLLAAPVRYERDTIGLLMVLAREPFNFDEGDVAVVESLAHTVVVSMRKLA